MSRLHDAVMEVTPIIEQLRCVDDEGGYIGSGLGRDGHVCHRCEGRGWFRMFGQRWTCPSCGRPHEWIDGDAP